MIIKFYQNYLIRTFLKELLIVFLVFMSLVFILNVISEIRFFINLSSKSATFFVSEGDAIGSDSVVCIVEAMKVMNEIKAEVSGKISKILVEDGAPVQFGQPLFLVKPA